MDVCEKARTFNQGHGQTFGRKVTQSEQGLVFQSNNQLFLFDGSLIDFFCVNSTIYNQNSVESALLIITLRFMFD